MTYRQQLDHYIAYDLRMLRQAGLPCADKTALIDEAIVLVIERERVRRRRSRQPANRQRGHK